MEHRSLVSIVLGLALAAGSCVGRAPPASPEQVPLELTRSPYVGVACPAANSTACDRLGIAVWLREEPSRVWATIVGKRVALAPPAGYGEDSRGAYAEGFLQPAGLAARPFSLPERWMGQPPIAIPLRIEATVRGRVAATTVEVRLASGWG